MKRKKDRSGKVAVIASMVVILLVGVSVFSLYSLSGNSILELAGLISGSADTTGTGRLLTRYDENAEYTDDQLHVAGTSEEAVEADDEGSFVSDSVIATDVTEEESTTAEPESETESETQKAEEPETTQEQTTPVPIDTELIVKDNTVPEEVVLGIAEDVAGKDLRDTQTTEDADVPAPASDEPQEPVVIEEPVAAVADVSEPEELAAAEEVSFFAGAMDVQNVAEDTSTWVPDDSADTVDDNGEWIFNYNTEEWVYVPNGSVEDNTDTADDGGEWIFDYDTEEWIYVANGYAEDDTDTADDGEWIFDYDTEEWIYVANGYAEDDTDTADDGEWIFDYDTEEWIYVASGYADDDTDTADDGGEWIFDYDTEEWIYVEGAGAAEESDNADDDTSGEDVIEPVGEWVYDEDAEEWIYVETIPENNAGGGAEEAEDIAEAETVSLGQQIVDYAMGYVGVTPYVWAGNSLINGTDCSGFVHLIFEHFGIYASNASLAYDGSEFGTVVGLDELQVGDIVVYGGGDHVAIYAGNGYVVHCSSPRNGTVYWDMTYRSDASWGLRIL